MTTATAATRHRPYLRGRNYSLVQSQPPQQRRRRRRRHRTPSLYQQASPFRDSAAPLEEPSPPPPYPNGGFLAATAATTTAAQSLPTPSPPLTGPVPLILTRPHQQWCRRIRRHRIPSLPPPPPCQASPPRYAHPREVSCFLCPGDKRRRRRRHRLGCRGRHDPWSRRRGPLCARELLIFTEFWIVLDLGLMCILWGTSGPGIHERLRPCMVCALVAFSQSALALANTRDTMQKKHIAISTVASRHKQTPRADHHHGCCVSPRTDHK